jgi:hypothetical protein
MGGTGGGTQTESWDGSAWTEVNDTNTSFTGFGMSGTITSALAFAGATESWNGTNWTNQNNMNITRTHIGGSRNGANNTAALAFGGVTPAPAVSAATEEWNGTGSITRTITSTTE